MLNQSSGIPRSRANIKESKRRIAVTACANAYEERMAAKTLVEADDLRQVSVRVFHGSMIQKFRLDPRLRTETAWLQCKVVQNDYIPSMTNPQEPFTTRHFEGRGSFSGDPPRLRADHPAQADTGPRTSRWKTATAACNGGTKRASACSSTWACTASSAATNGPWKRKAFRWPNIEQLAKQFNPKPQRRARLGQTGQAAGMKYMVMTTKHHEGFCHFDTKLTDYCAPKQAADAIWWRNMWRPPEPKDCASASIIR